MNVRPILSATLLSLAALPVSAADYVMRISHQWNPAMPQGHLVELFEQEVEATTGGRLDVQVFPSAQLYKPNQQHAAIASGELESAIIADFILGGAVPEIAVSFVPYMGTDFEKVKAFNASEAAKLLDEKLAEKQMKNLAWMVETTNGIFLSKRKPLKAPEDFDGLKIRGLTKMFDLGLAALGAVPTAMPGAEIYQSLQTGVIDSTITTIHSAHARKFQEVQEYGVVTPNIAFIKNVFVVSPAWWDGLPEDIRQAIQEGATTMAEHSVPKTPGLSEDDLAKLEELKAGGLKVSIMTPEEEAAMAEVMQKPVLDAFMSSSPDAAQLIDLM